MDRSRLDGRTALVTGASRGIGAAIARALDQAGARVAVAARTQSELEAVAAGLVNDPVVLVADLAEAAAAADLAVAAEAALGRVDVLVNNAAVARRAPTVRLDAGVVDLLYAVNVRAPLLLIAALLPGMIERRRGAIVNLSSGVGRGRNAEPGGVRGHQGRHRRRHPFPGHHGDVRRPVTAHGRGPATNPPGPRGPCRPSPTTRWATVGSRSSSSPATSRWPTPATTGSSSTPGPPRGTWSPPRSSRCRAPGSPVAAVTWSTNRPTSASSSPRFSG